MKQINMWHHSQFIDWGAKLKTPSLSSSLTQKQLSLVDFETSMILSEGIF